MIIQAIRGPFIAFRAVKIQESSRKNSEKKENLGKSLGARLLPLEPLNSRKVLGKTRKKKHKDLRKSPILLYKALEKALIACLYRLRTKKIEIE